jgi:tRNA wybutosine-synthesizing protein 4
MDPNIIARQRKKVEKDRRRKQYDDLQVQGTNNSSIVSKRSVEMLYTQVLNPEFGEWFKYFVKKPKRRSPAINRGYWIRMESIRQMVLRIALANKDKRVHVINLGCGFDPLPFQLASTTGDMTFLDLDYPDLVANKLAMIRESSEIIDVIGEEIKEDMKLGVVLSTSKYKLVGCDLKNAALYKEQLDHLLPNDDSIKIFIAEVSLAYMEPQYANAVIDISSKVSNSHFLILEQILPNTGDEAFAQKMMYHFNHLRSPLRCVEHYPLEADQETRFRKYYGDVEIRNLFENWLVLVDDDVKAKVTQIEDFDEWEEFIIFCQHYVIVHATNDGGLIYPKKAETLSEIEASKMLLSVEKLHPQLQVKFAAVCSRDDEVLVHGGLFQTRSDKTLVLKNGEVCDMEIDGPSPRMCHELVTMSNGSIIMTGGRSRPGHAFNEVFELENGGSNWKPLAPMIEKRSRHSAIPINEHEILIIGGLIKSGVLIEKYNILTQSSTPMNVVGFPHANLSSCGATLYNSTQGIVLGGMYNQEIPLVNDVAYKFTITNDTITFESWIKHSLFERIGPKLVFRNHCIVIIGGISPTKISDASTTIISLNMQTEKLHGVIIDSQVMKQFPPMLVGFGIGTHPEGIKVIGGGGVCYSFGSYYSPVYVLTGSN